MLIVNYFYILLNLQLIEINRCAVSLEYFIEETNLAVNAKDVFEIYSKAMNKLGFDKIVYTFITDHIKIGQTAGHGILSNYPSDWLSYYHEKGYQKIDPVMRKGLYRGPAFSWKHLEETSCFKMEQTLFMREAEDAGLLSGVGIPLHRDITDIAGVGIASSSKININKNLLSVIQFLTEQFHNVYCDLIKENSYSSPTVTLTDKEIEVLKWLANGKNNYEISDILNISVSAIKFHVQNIYTKLSANDRILAVTKAIRMGIIPIETIGIKTILD